MLYVMMLHSCRLATMLLYTCPHLRLWSGNAESALAAWLPCCCTPALTCGCGQAMLSHHSRHVVDTIGTAHHTVTQTERAGQKWWMGTVQSPWHEVKGITGIEVLQCAGR